MQTIALSTDLQAPEELFLQEIDHKLSREKWIYIFFGVALATEITLLVFFFPVLIQSAFFAFIIALLLLTLFGMLLFQQYSSSEKKSYFEELVNEWLEKEKSTPFKKGDPEAHVKISKTCSKLADRLYQKEYKLLPTPKKLPFLTKISETTSCWLYWKDILQIRELLLQKAVEEHLDLVRAHPATLDAHTLLANAYVMLSGLYVKGEQDRWIPQERYGEESAAKFRKSAERAIEEFKIIKDYAPKDPWIYSQLAFSYRELKMPDEERAAYEALLDLKPNDHDTRFKLGALYFQQGQNAKGLKVYDALKKSDFSRADELLTIYGKEPS